MKLKKHVLSQLTKKQREVLALVADNRTSKEIATLIGISESAVNQRIEAIRARLGWIPRGELARLYRQVHHAPEPELQVNSVTWEKIQVPQSTMVDQGEPAEAVLFLASGSHRSTAEEENGSQLTATLFQADKPWLWRKNGVTALVRFAATAAIITAAVGFAAIASGALALPGS